MAYDPFPPQQQSYDDLDSFATDYKPEQQRRPDLDGLPDGDYDFEVLDAILDRTTKGTRILKVGIQPQNGLAVNHTYWLDQQDKLNGLAADLCLLGFDAHKWGTQERPLSQELPKAVSKLPGIRFRAAKRSNLGTGQHAGRTFHNLYICSRITGKAMPTNPGATTSNFNEFATPPSNAPAPTTKPQPAVAFANSAPAW